ncbi:hypothetical protein, partial [Nocardioides sp. GCM10030258]|uniref:hypothetical protein n=1 Tax=unclassified Nocardioides TaxID=2615069 RepID=UPI00361624B6
MRTSRRRQFLGAFCGLLAVAAGLALPGTAHGADEEPDLPDDVVRVLIVGDSVTQGSSGDWTWRYRLWRHLQDAGLAVD